MATPHRLQSYYYKHKLLPISSFMRCMQSKGAKEFMDEKAPSTAQVMKSMEQEKDRQSETGIGSDKARDAAQEAVLGDSPTPGSVMESYKQDSSAGEDHRQTGDTSHSTI